MSRRRRAARLASARRPTPPKAGFPTTPLRRRGGRLVRSGDRLLLVLTPDPSSAALIRRGRRVADYLRRVWLSTCRRPRIWAISRPKSARARASSELRAGSGSKRGSCKAPTRPRRSSRLRGSRRDADLRPETEIECTAIVVRVGVVSQSPPTCRSRSWPADRPARNHMNALAFSCSRPC
jgi:hypothetical protein